MVPRSFREQINFCSHKKPNVPCRHIGKVSCCGFTALFMWFRKSKIVKYAVIVTFVAVQYTTFQ